MMRANRPLQSVRFVSTRREFSFFHFFLKNANLRFTYARAHFLRSRRPTTTQQQQFYLGKTRVLIFAVFIDFLKICVSSTPNGHFGRDAYLTGLFQGVPWTLKSERLVYARREFLDFGPLEKCKLFFSSIFRNLRLAYARRSLLALCDLIFFDFRGTLKKPDLRLAYARRSFSFFSLSFFVQT